MLCGVVGKVKRYRRSDPFTTPHIIENQVKFYRQNIYTRIFCRNVSDASLFRLNFLYLSFCLTKPIRLKFDINIHMLSEMSCIVFGPSLVCYSASGSYIVLDDIKNWILRYIRNFILILIDISPYLFQR